MKTKELIKLLQEADPSGEAECCVGNADIWFVETLPAYYDGTLQVLQRDDEGLITGAKYVRNGEKVSIHVLPISDLVRDDLDCKLNIDYSELPEDQQRQTKDRHAELRKCFSDILDSVELEYFETWARQKAGLLTADIDDFKWDARKFFEENLSRNDPLLDKDVSKSYVERRNKQWDDTIEVVSDEGFLKIIFKESVNDKH